MSRIAFTGLVLVLLLFTALGSSAQSQDEFTVVPGRGIGRIALGMTINEVVAMLGVPKSTHSTPSSSLTRYSWFGASISHARLGVLASYRPFLLIEH